MPRVNYPGYPGKFDEDALIPQEIAGFTTDQLIQFYARRDALVAKLGRKRRKDDRRHGEGLRIRLNRIPGITKGRAKRVLHQPYRFQCAPLDEFTVPTTRAPLRWTNYAGVEFVNKGGMLLRQLTFRTIAVEYGRFTIEYDWHIDALVNDLKKLVKAGQPFEFLATHDYNRQPEVHMDTLLEDVKVTENAGEVDARYLDLTFTQWRDPVVGRRRLRADYGDWPKFIHLNKNGKDWETDMKVPVKVGKKLDADEWTFALIAKHAYGRPGLADHVAAAQKPRIRIGQRDQSWGAHEPILKHPRYKGGAKIRIPAPPAQGEWLGPSGEPVGSVPGRGDLEGDEDVITQVG